jgi:hypothetical protein
VPTEGLEGDAKRGIAEKTRQIAEGGNDGSSVTEGPSSAIPGDRSNASERLIDSIDPVESALAESLRLATEAGRWDVVTLLAGELSARRLARTAPAVASVEVERARRDGKR